MATKSVEAEMSRVATLPAGAFRPVDRIVVPVEGTDQEFIAQQWAAELAAALALPLQGLHVAADGLPGSPDVFEFLTRECKQWGVALESRTLNGADIVEEIVQELQPRDLVVVGTRLMASRFHMGSVASELVRRAPCPVQIVRLTETRHAPPRIAKPLPGPRRSVPPRRVRQPTRTPRTVGGTPRPRRTR